MINGGYILQPRIIQESDISVAPPYVREIWNYLLREANCQDNKYNGHEIKRGQLFRSYDDIKEGTKWFIGWRKMVYNENQVKKAMKFLRDTLRIDTKKELGGVMITICKYDYYQTPKNYERTTNEPMDGTNEEPIKNQPLPDNNKNDKNDKNNNKEILKKEKFSFLKSLIELGVSERVANDWLEVRKLKRAANTETAFNRIKSEIEKTNASAEQCIVLAVEKSWQGFKAEWYANTNQNKKFKNNSVTEYTDKIY